MKHLDALPLDSLIQRYAEAAASHGAATETGDAPAANAAHQVVAACYRELRRRGLEAQQALLPLLDHPDVGVRSWAGAHALEFSPTDGERVLLGLSTQSRSLIGFAAKMTLSLWREGNLKFP
jgi:hypothetical protein